jgi:aryl-alcohol dehydrogenase-like predicted oxidoreductase
MEYRRLGRSGLKISEIAYGNWVTHGGQIGDDAAKQCVQAAWDEGVTFFDTADAYMRGGAETVLGEALQELKLTRSDVVVATKVYWPMSRNPNDRGLSRKHIIESCEKSLRRLQTDYVDLYQAHRMDPDVPLDETLRAFDDLVRQGKVLYIGVSEWDAPTIRQALDIAAKMGFDRIVSSQPQYNMLWRVIEPEVVPLCRKEGIGQIVWSPMAQGALTGKYLPGQPAAPGTRAAEKPGWMDEYLGDEVLTAVQKLKPLAESAGLSLATMAVAWVLQNNDVSAAIVGATRPEQVRENVKASGVKLDDDLLAAIDDVLGPHIVRDPTLTASG